MCGFVGEISNTVDPKIIGEALDRIKHRGPDYQGYYFDEGIALGHARLSIIDLNDRSNQPLFSKCGDFILLFNGEIYNYKYLKNNLQNSGVTFLTDSDSEVILQAFIKYGVGFTSLLEGMYAIAIYSIKEKRLDCFRDPLGIKPLYFTSINERFIFSSQVSAIRELVNVEKSSISYEGFNVFGSILEPYTYYDNIVALKPGGHLCYRNGEITEKRLVEFKITNGGLNEEYSLERLAKTIDNLLLDSVKRHLVADVPVALFLSGGLDSAYLAYQLSNLLGDRLTAITISFKEIDESKINEVDRAKAIARSLGIRHEIRRYDENDFLSEIENIFEAMDQPTIDGVNTYFAAKFASELGFKVVLSGTGGDELLSGYNYYRTSDLLIRSRWVDVIVRIFGKLGFNKPEKLKFIGLGLGSWSSYWLLRRSRGTASKKLYSNFRKKIHETFETGEIDSSLMAQVLDIKHYLLNQLLRDSDWASMYHSVELRTPLVDYRLYDELFKMSNGISRYGKQQILSEILKDKIPKDVLSARKTGFSIPIDVWSRKSFGKDWANLVEEKFYN